MDVALFKRLLQQQEITAEEFHNIEQKQNGTISVYPDITTLLYTGILLLATGLGILIYQHINTLGHAVITASIATLCIASFVYCISKSAGYSNEKSPSPGFLYDYILAGGCLLLLTLAGYLQFQYHFFGTHWGLATFVPMIILFVAAYYFDHLGVLSMAITSLAAWAGLTVAPLQVLQENDFQEARLLYTGMLLGAGLLGCAYLSGVRKVKAHFSNTYQNFGTHIFFISLLAGTFTQGVYFLWFLVLLSTTLFFCISAVKTRSFYYLVVAILYGYIGLSYVTCRILWMANSDDAPLFLTFLYFIVSGIVLIRLLLHFNKKLKKNADL